MDTLYLIIFFIFGTYFGSFFTVIGLRLPKNENFTTSHSHCDSCNHQLKLYDMVPIISFLLQRGKCRYCKAKIDPLSTFVEFFTGLLFAVSYYSFGFSWEFVIGLGIISLLMIVLVSDLTYLIIPDEVLIFFSIYFIICQIFNVGIVGVLLKVGSGIFLFSVLYFIMLVGNKILKKECLGGGDIKMMFVFGLILEPLLGTLSIFLGSFIALPISLILLRNQDEKQIPFGPFLLIALAIIYFTKLTPDAVVNFLTYK